MESIRPCYITLDVSRGSVTRREAAVLTGSFSSTDTTFPSPSHMVKDFPEGWTCGQDETLVITPLWKTFTLSIRQGYGPP